ncbi:lasso RiPP family leader peptide-containing protein [Streptomyces halobius]|uniref:Lasso RiPP family leader peptide-containing protein n=1 Tax=Streptomyces halobius TaxID=2879846 RepID=A0ABY4MFQ3_9ACTN|nr:lasso RiPP family leader peptide-containing protein [Streptomyces halobius]UQA95161.1 lasso RiPP family leader peptide-containing protein [Streptomyces halobius]
MQDLMQELLQELQQPREHAGYGGHVGYGEHAGYTEQVEQAECGGDVEHAECGGDVEQVEYEVPELADVGDFAELTPGLVGWHHDAFGGHFWQE